MSLPSSTTHRRGPFSQGSFQAILAGLSQERDALRHDVERLERQERALVDNEEALVRKHQSLILTSRHVQEELGVVRRQEVMLREQKQQLQKVLESDRREMDAATEQQVALEQDRIQRKRAFIRDMEKRNEHLSHALSQEHDGMWNRRLSAETAQLMWTKVMQWQQQQQQQHGDDPTNNNVLKELKESVDHLTRVWTQLSHMVEMYERNQDERMQMRAFILEHRDEQEDHNVPITEEELLDMEHRWAQQDHEPSEHQQSRQGGNDGEDNMVDEDRILMPPPLPPAHMQLFYGTQSSEPDSMSADDGGVDENTDPNNHHHSRMG